MTERTGATHSLMGGRIDGTLEAVRSHLIAVEKAAAAGSIDESRRVDMLIVLGEVLNNIVEHALADARGGWIECRISVAGRGLSIETCDNGKPLPPDLLGGASLPDFGSDLSDVPEGGFGWFIVHSLTDDMTYERLDGLNRLSFSLRTKPPSDQRQPEEVPAT
ncbi:ATP-binding protein [Jannaschia seohaensis]|uniref:Serine/threonine-protein kinase RsbW n=1 Tax=Jannaschia seohaensis TaxID=475081 RepID=A0A2Y9B1F7_9RHOB|nr:ATP-binding protein [Jannaschia seohaensis]PWJ14494.1 serine/threonine-protein kinase RsbW [Jannaschia seohaensis]SSA50256.1 serine/threonine-protein kinase RsbW [Jannaschia seohaensis]